MRLREAPTKLLFSFVLILLFVVVSYSQTCQPPNYCARTDLTPIALPTLTVPAINGSFVDNVSNKTITRITGLTTLSPIDPAYNNHHFQVSSGSEQNVWSKSFASGGHTHYRYYYEHVEGGTPHFIDWDGNTNTFTFTNGWGNSVWPTASFFPAKTGGTWSYTNDGYFYAIDNNTSTTLKKFDFNNKTVSVVKDWSTGCGATLSNQHIGEPTVDVTDNYFSIYGGGASQDLDPYVMVWKIGSGCRYLNTQTGVVGGDWGPTGSIVKKNSTGGSSSWPGFFLHNARLSPDGNYVRITGCQPGCGDVIYVWDLNTTDVKSCVGGTDSCYGHMGWAWTTLINQENSSSDAIRYATRNYSNLSSAGLTYVANPTIVPAENIVDSHLSSAFSNAQQSALITCGGSYRSDGSPPNGFQPYTRQHRPYDNEIYCMTLNAGANAPMFRITHTFTTAREPATEVSCSSVSRSGSTISAVCNSHGLSNGQTAVFVHTDNGTLDGFCGYGLSGVTVTGANTFTCTDEKTGTVAATTARVSMYNGLAPFESLPRGNMSQDGRFYAFASDMLGQLGNTSGGSCAIGTTCRTDVFVVQLAPMGSSNPTKCNWDTALVCN